MISICLTVALNIFISEMSQISISLKEFDNYFIFKECIFVKILFNILQKHVEILKLVTQCTRCRNQGN